MVGWLAARSRVLPPSAGPPGVHTSAGCALLSASQPPSPSRLAPPSLAAPRCDYLATLHHMNICGTGYGSYFVLSMFDKLWHPDVTEQVG